MRVYAAPWRCFMQEPSDTPAKEEPYGPQRALITSALPYVNNVPHLGNLIPILSADAYTRYLRQRGTECIYICATDEHGTRTEQEAQAAGLDEDTYCRQRHDQIASLFAWFHVDFDHFGRTSCETNHTLTKQLFLQAAAKGAITHQQSQQLYCGSCAHFLPDGSVRGTCPHCDATDIPGDQCDRCSRLIDPFELVTPRCVHCGDTPQQRETHHLYLRLDRLAPRLQEWLKEKNHWQGIVRSIPQSWLAEGLRPRAITRDLRWGIKVPEAALQRIDGFEDLDGFDQKVFYVWFDAPIGYIAATAEWAKREGEPLSRWWKSDDVKLIHFLGKDNVPFHTLMWPATLLAADEGWHLPDEIPANAYLTYEGSTFSKSRKVGVFTDQVQTLGIPADVFRYVLLSQRPEKRDADFSWTQLQRIVNTELVGNIGNFANRLVSFVAKHFGEVPTPGPLHPVEEQALIAAEVQCQRIDEAFASFSYRKAIKELQALSAIGNKTIQERAPWQSHKEDRAQCQTTLFVCSQLLVKLANAAWPVIPKTSETIFGWLGLKPHEPLQAGRPVQAPKGYLFSPISDQQVVSLQRQFCGTVNTKGNPAKSR